MAQPLTQAEINAIFTSGIYPSQSQWQQIASTWRSTMLESSSPSSAVNLAVADSRSQTMSPTTNINVKMVKTGRRADEAQFLFNKSLTNTITLISDNNDVICILIPNSWVVIVSKIAAPNAKTDWYTADAGGGWAAATLIPADFNASFGSVSVVGAKAMRQGPFYRLKTVFTIGTAGTGLPDFKIPSGITISTASFPTYASFGIVRGLFIRAGVTTPLGIGVYNGTDLDKVRVFHDRPTFDNGSGTVVDANTYLINNETYEADLAIPAVGYEIGG